MSERREYEDRVRSELQLIEQEIDKLREHLSNVEQELAPEHHQKVLELHAMKETTKEKFAELVEAGDEAWGTLKHGMDHLYAALGNELKAYDDPSSSNES
jgi:hypothetical protein